MDGGKSSFWFLIFTLADNDFGGMDPNDDNGNQNNQEFGEGQQQDEDVDQYFDDGGETFLPADHVCNWCTVTNPNFRYLWLGYKTLLLSNWQTSTNVSIFNWEKRKKKCAKFASPVKTQVSNFMVSNTNLQRCKLLSSALTTIITSFRDIELKLNVNTKFFKDNMRVRKRKLMSSSNAY